VTEIACFFPGMMKKTDKESGTANDLEKANTTEASEISTNSATQEIQEWLESFLGFHSCIPLLVKQMYDDGFENLELIKMMELSDLSSYDLPEDVLQNILDELIKLRGESLPNESSQRLVNSQHVVNPQQVDSSQQIETIERSGSDEIAGNTILYKKLDGTTKGVMISDSALVSELRIMIAAREQVDAKNVLIIYAGRRLEDQYNLQEYNLQKESTV